MAKGNREIRRQTPSKRLRREMTKSEYQSLLSLLDILESVSRRESRPTYTSYFVNMAVQSA